jgi:phosphatidate cytidylyltransferase
VSLVVIHRYNAGILLFVLAVIVVADTAAFFTGRRWGKTKLAPALSPGKTREGLFGALAATGLLGTLGAWLLRIDLVMWPYFVALVWITTLLSVTGDLFESLLKREAGVKDSGTLLPGHGGVLDRIDSLTAGAPAFALGFQWLEA